MTILRDCIDRCDEKHPRGSPAWEDCVLECLRDPWESQQARRLRLYDLAAALIGAILVVAGVFFVAVPDITLPTAWNILGGGFIASGATLAAVRLRMLAKPPPREPGDPSPQPS